MTFDELRDPETGRIRTRTVDIESEYYQVAREYMIRLTPGDLENGPMLGKLSQAAKMNPKVFANKFSVAAGDHQAPGRPQRRRYAA